MSPGAPYTVADGTESCTCASNESATPHLWKSTFCWHYRVASLPFLRSWLACEQASLSPCAPSAPGCPGPGRLPRFRAGTDTRSLLQVWHGVEVSGVLQVPWPCCDAVTTVLMALTLLASVWGFCAPVCLPWEQGEAAGRGAAVCGSHRHPRRRGNAAVVGAAGQ